jgi:hypothetical protein
LVKAPEVGAKRFRFRNHRLMTGESLSEGMEAPVCVDIIDHYRPTRSKVWPCAIQFKSHVALAMQAIVNEKVNLPEMSQQLGKAQSARTLNVRPPKCETLIDRDTYLLSPILFKRRQIDTPKMAFSVSFHRFKDEARGNAVSDASFYDSIGP